MLLFLAALEKVLLDQGIRVSAGAGVGAAVRVYAQAEAVAVGRTSSPSAERGNTWPPRTAIPNQGPMSDFVGPFDVPSRLTDQTYHVRFSHLWNGIATRHSDTVDTKFFVDGRGVVVGLAHTGIRQLSASAPAATSPIARPASSPPSICASGWSRKTSARSTTSPKPTSSA